MKILIFQKITIFQKKKYSFWRLGFFQNWEKNHLNSIVNGAEFRPLRTPKKSVCNAVLSVLFYLCNHLSEEEITSYFWLLHFNCVFAVMCLLLSNVSTLSRRGLVCDCVTHFFWSYSLFYKQKRYGQWIVFTLSQIFKFEKEWI